jgi:hypothetical protein
MANNDLDRLVGAMCSPAEVKRVLGQTAKRLLDEARMSNLNPVHAKRFIEVALLKLAQDRGYARFGVNSTVGKLVGKMMTGYKSGYDQLQTKLEKAEERYERHERSAGGWRYWDAEMRDAFLREYWGPPPKSYD